MKRLALLAFVGLALDAHADVAFDAYSNNTADFGFTWSHNGGTPRGVMCEILYETDDPASGVTYGGAALTKHATEIAAPASGELVYEIIETWFLGSSIPTGTQTVVVSGTTADMVAACVTVSGSADTEIVDVDGVASAAAANPRVTLGLGGRTSFAWIHGYSGVNAVGDVAPITGWTSRYEQDYGTWVGFSYTYNTIGTTDVSAGPDQGSDDAWFVAVAVSEVSASTDPEITSVTPDELEDEDTGIVIAGSNFEAAQGTGTVVICPTDDIMDADCEGQTETAWADDEITFTAVQGDNALFTTAYLFVTNDTGDSNADGVEVTFVAAPTVSSPTPSGTLMTATTATLGATSNDDEGTFYGVVDDETGITSITASQIKLGNDSGDAAAIASCNDTVASTSPSCGVTGLTANTTYHYAVVHTNSTGDSNVETGTFTTAEESSGSVVPLILQQIAANDDEYERRLVATSR